jgi:hypothetical protein
MVLLGKWRARVLAGRSCGEACPRKEAAKILQQIGQLKVELDWLKKKLVCSTNQKRQLIEPDNDSISVCRLGTTRLLFSSSSK